MKHYVISKEELEEILFFNLLSIVFSSAAISLITFWICLSVNTLLYAGITCYFIVFSIFWVRKYTLDKILLRKEKE